MSAHTCIVGWERTSSPEDFVRGRYSREHLWSFDGGLKIPASPSPVNVPAPFSNAAHVDPEEAFVAAISSCHLLTFVWLASKEHYVIDRYEDHASGVTSKNEAGVAWVSDVTLKVRIDWSGDRRPSPAEEERLHHLAHEQCFIANSVKTKITVARQSH